MPDISVLLRGINPVRILFYFDRMRIWLREPLSSQDRKSLEQNCPGMYEESALFGPYYHKVELYQPNEFGLATLAHLPDDAMVTYLEPTCDVIMTDVAQMERVLDAFKHGFRQPWHRKKGVQSYSSGFSTRTPPKPGERRAGSWFNWYIDHPCKLTGEAHCFHFEGKNEGRQFVKRLGIQHPRDLKDFDFDAYFRKHMRLYRVDLERLGRYHHNKRTRAKRKRTSPDDRKRGMILYRVLSAHADQEDRSLQRFLDQYGTGAYPYLTSYNIYDHWHKSVTSQSIPIIERQLPRDKGNAKLSTILIYHVGT